MIGDRDCLFPELPRITHQGADGFTVSKRGQMELYSNLRLSQLPVSVNYGDLSRLTRQGYIEETELFVRRAKRLHVLEEVRKYRHDKLVYVVPAADDKDDEWNAALHPLLRTHRSRRIRRTRPDTSRSTAHTRSTPHRSSTVSRSRACAHCCSSGRPRVLDRSSLPLTVCRVCCAAEGCRCGASSAAQCSCGT